MSNPTPPSVSITNCFQGWKPRDWTSFVVDLVSIAGSVAVLVGMDSRFGTLAAIIAATTLVLYSVVLKGKQWLIWGLTILAFLVAIVLVLVPFPVPLTAEVFVDKNKNAQLDGAESGGPSDMALILHDSNGRSSTKYTDKDGVAKFPGVPRGPYSIELPDGQTTGGKVDRFNPRVLMPITQTPTNTPTPAPSHTPSATPTYTPAATPTDTPTPTCSRDLESRHWDTSGIATAITLTSDGRLKGDFDGTQVEGDYKADFFTADLPYRDWTACSLLKLDVENTLPSDNSLDMAIVLATGEESCWNESALWIRLEPGLNHLTFQLDTADYKRCPDWDIGFIKEKDHVQRLHLIFVLKEPLIGTVYVDNVQLEG